MITMIFLSFLLSPLQSEARGPYWEQHLDFVYYCLDRDYVSRKTIRKFDSRLRSCRLTRNDWFYRRCIKKLEEDCKHDLVNKYNYRIRTYWKEVR